MDGETGRLVPIKQVTDGTGTEITLDAPAERVACLTMIIVLLITGLNLLNVKVFGELEFWLSVVKVTAIILMIVGGFAILLFGFGRQAVAEVELTGPPEAVEIVRTTRYGL